MTSTPTADGTLSRERQAVDAALDRLLPAAAATPARLHEAMRYAVFAGGKRLRPLLTLAACRACGGDDDSALAAAAAIEMIHTYSLIHDDLPAMDNDSLRRGKATTHVAYGEALAILAGDALLNRAMEICAGAVDLAGLQPVPAGAAAALATAAGSAGMIGGQVLDLAAEGRQLDLASLEDLHRRKTGALITAAILMGGHCAGAAPSALDALERCGEATGLAFQVVDDILDCTASTADLGKSAGKDARAGKSTFPALLGLAASRAKADELTRQALDALAPMGPAADDLRRLVRRAGERTA